MWLFAYGSIQPGCWNEIPGLVAGETIPGTIRGDLYWAMRVGSYPIAKVNPLSESVIHGTWMEVDISNEAWDRTYWMEIGAGYELVNVGDDKADIVGLVFDYPHDIRPDLKIESGNWLEEIRKVHNPYLTD